MWATDIEDKRALFNRMYAPYRDQYDLLGIRTFDEHLERKAGFKNEHIEYQYDFMDEHKFIIISDNQLLFNDFAYLTPLLFRREVVFVCKNGNVPPIKLGAGVPNVVLFSIEGYCIVEAGIPFWHSVSSVGEIQLKSVVSFKTVRMNDMRIEKLSLGYVPSKEETTQNPLSFISNIDLSWLRYFPNLKSLTLNAVDLSTFNPLKTCADMPRLKLMNGTLNAIPMEWSKLLVEKFACINMCLTTFPAEQLAGMKYLKHVDFSNNLSSAWPNRNDFSSQPIIFDLRLVHLESLNLNDAGVYMLYFPSFSRDYRNLTQLYVRNNELDKKYTTNVWTEGENDIRKLEAIVTGGRWVAPVVLRQKHLTSIGTGNIMVPGTSLNFDSFKISRVKGDRETEVTFDLFQEIWLHNTDTQSYKWSMEGYDPLEEDDDGSKDEEELERLREERETKNTEESNQSALDHIQFDEMIESIQDTINETKNTAEFYHKIRTLLTTYNVYGSDENGLHTDCDADRAARAEFEQRPPRVFSNVRLFDAVQTRENGLTPARLNEYYLSRLIGKDVIVSNMNGVNVRFFTEGNVLEEFNNYLKSKYVDALLRFMDNVDNAQLRMNAESDRKFVKNSSVRLHQIADLLIHRAIVGIGDDVARNVRIAGILDGTFSFSDGDIQNAISTVDNDSFHPSKMDERRRDERQYFIVHYSNLELNAMVKDMSQSANRFYDAYKASVESRYNTRGIQLRDYTVVVYETWFRTNYNEASYNADYVEILTDDLLCRTKKLFPLAITSPSNNTLNIISEAAAIFNSPDVAADNRWLFEKLLGALIDNQERNNALWVEHDVEVQEIYDRISRNIDAGMDIVTINRDAQARADAANLAERIALENTLEQRMQYLRELAINDPAAMAELTAQMARNAIAAHEMRDPTAAEVERAIANIDAIVMRKVPFFKAYDPTDGVDIEGAICGICQDPFEESNQPYVPSTEHVEMFNPLRANLDYDAIVVDEIERFPGQAAVVCNFVKSDFPDGEDRAGEHHKHFFHYACAAQIIQSQKQMNETYHCVIDLTGVYGTGIDK